MEAEFVTPEALGQAVVPCNPVYVFRPKHIQRKLLLGAPF